MAKFATMLVVSAGLLALPLALASARAAAAPKVHTVVIDKMKFGPLPRKLAVGDAILWVNKDIFRHTATALDRSFDVDLPSKASGKTVVKRAGTISFYCRYHPGMTGSFASRKTGAHLGGK